MSSETRAVALASAAGWGGVFGGAVAALAAAMREAGSAAAGRGLRAGFAAGFAAAALLARFRGAAPATGESVILSLLEPSAERSRACRDRPVFPPDHDI